MDDAGKIAAIGQAQAVIEFNMDGTIVTANENFLDALGYSLDEIKGKHHSMFVDAGRPRQRRLSRVLGEAEPRRIPGRPNTSGSARAARRSGSRPPTTRSSTRPASRSRSSSSPPTSPQQKLKAADYDGQIAAIGKSQAVIEFNMDGTIRTANENFLDALGYTLDEIQGQHHGMFVEPAERNSAGIPRVLGQRSIAANTRPREYKRIAKGGREIWIQASYNPILDLNGKPFKVVKYATDITAQAIARKKAENAPRR